MEKKGDLDLVFIDFEKAWDMIPRAIYCGGFWKEDKYLVDIVI